MKKSTKLNVEKAIAKEFGVKANQVILCESTGDIENFNNFDYSEEFFSLAIKTSKHINLGFHVPVYGTKNYGKITYTVDSGLIQRNEAFDDYIK